MTATSPPRVLLVDDNDLLRGAVARLLARHFDITQAAGGTAAIEALRVGSFGAVVVDIDMPEVSGVDVYEWICEQLPSLSKRVVIFSAGPSDPEKIAWLHSYDQTLVVMKPSPVEVIAAAIRRALARAQ